MDNANVTIELEGKIKELAEVTRIIDNGLKLVNSISIKVSDIVPVQEFIGFLVGMQRNISQQRVTLEAALPKKELEVVEAVK